MEITQNCIINAMPENDYHNDPTPLEAEGFAEYTSLSSSVALAVVEETEIEARGKVNRFNPKTEEKASTDAMNLGSMVHDRVLLGETGKRLYEIVPFKDFRTDAAKARRDDLIARGIIPLAQNKKTDDLIESLSAMERRLHEQLAEHIDYPGLMKDGKGEQSGFYFDENLGIWKRARFDWLDEKYQDIVWDYKTTALSLKKWINQELWKEKYIQAPHYASVLSGITGRPCKFGFVVQRTVEPYLLEIVVIDDSFMEDVSNRYKLAEKKFAKCLRSGAWEGASKYTIHSCPPPWILGDWEADTLNEKLKDQRDEDEQKEPEAPPADVRMAG